MKGLLKIIEKNKIIFDHFDFKDHYFGMYLQLKGMRPAIYLHKKLPDCSPLTRCVLAEEIGHHFTMTGDTIHQHINYPGRIHINKIEKAALKWACHQLIPDEKLYNVIKKNNDQSIYHLANHFYVTEDFMKFRLQLFYQNEYWLKKGSLYQRIRQKEVIRQLTGGVLYL